MSDPTTDPEMKQRFEEALKFRIAESPLRQPPLSPDASFLRAHFDGPVGQAATPLKNPHVEPRVTDEDRTRAVPASVLIAIVLRDAEPTILLTRRHPSISFPGHWVFPGGRADARDADPIETAVREAEEEIGLDRNRVEVLGRLGEYVSHSGFRITPAVALIEPPIQLTPQPGEVDKIAEIPLARLLDSNNYFLYQFENRVDRVHFAMDCEIDDLLLTGVTVSIAIGLYGELLKSREHGQFRVVER